jgi:hypothetical protein
MADPNCEECRGTGVIETESVAMGRPYYSKEFKQMVVPTVGNGIWQKTVCYCLSDEKEEC